MTMGRIFRYLGCSILIIGLQTSLLVAVSAQQQQQQQVCTLACENQGICEFVSDDHDHLAWLVQSGKPIQKCVCPEGFTGSACELELRRCHPTTRKCYNGKSCTTKSSSTGEESFTCACAEADYTSSFAAKMCRKPFTEYCANQYDPTETKTSFCTNGGKCKSSIIGAQLAPGNTTVNQAFRHLGCICPPEFYGPHCEILAYDRSIVWPEQNFDEPAEGHNDGNGDAAKNGESEGSGDDKFSSVKGMVNDIFVQDNLFYIGAAVFGIVCLCSLCCCMVFLTRSSRRRKTLKRTSSTNDILSADEHSQGSSTSNLGIEKRQDDRGAMMSALIGSTLLHHDSQKQQQEEEHLRHRKDSYSTATSSGTGGGERNRSVQEQPYICDDDDDDEDYYEGGYGNDGILYDRGNLYHGPSSDYRDRPRRHEYHRRHHHHHHRDHGHDGSYDNDDEDDRYLGGASSRSSYFSQHDNSWHRHPLRESWEEQRMGLEPDANRRRRREYEKSTGMHIPTIS